MPDSICGGQSVSVTYNGPGGLDLFWDFNSGDLYETPVGLNYGNLGSPAFPQDLKLIKADNTTNKATLICSHIKFKYIIPTLDYPNQRLNSLAYLKPLFHRKESHHRFL